MKYILALFLLVSCSNADFAKFRVGDCISDQHLLERWDITYPSNSYNIFKIKEKGKYKYLQEWVYPKYMDNELTDETFISVDNSYLKVECPK